MRKIAVSVVVGFVTLLVLLVVMQSRGAEAAIPNALVGLSPLPTPTPTVPSPLYMPAVFRKWSLLTELLETKYLFAEWWTNDELGPGCPPWRIDFPFYHFSPSTGELTVYAGPMNDVLTADDIGYLGSGHSLSGVGGGVASSLTSFAELPRPTVPGAFTLKIVAPSGTVMLVRDGESMLLEPGQSWSTQTVRQVETPPIFPGDCVITSTNRITNYGFLSRDQIRYFD